MQLLIYDNLIGWKIGKKIINNLYFLFHRPEDLMGSACTSESRSPSPVYGRNGVILKRPPSVTSYELRMERMNAEVAEVSTGAGVSSGLAGVFSGLF